ncbi:MAG: hypothetical protein JXR30_02145 [Alphaproteobacteria bacterium]|nr:hypothetical protein [Alphaproteobacteria bacterium]
MSEFDSILENIRLKIQEKQEGFRTHPASPSIDSVFQLSPEMILQEKKDSHIKIAENITEELVRRFNLYSQRMQIYGLVLDKLFSESKKLEN